ncbi:MAG TPA: ABC transporter ATP-binding protein [Syntrophorhabdales bacterium]|nr:ABC transporter ATP-binding protein [Syntrophorhabdales bacterium]
MELSTPECRVPERRDPADLQLKIGGLCTAYGEAQVLRDVDLSVYANEVVAILGSNGAGKTTLLRALTGLVQPTRGGIVFRGDAMEGLPPHAIIRKGVASVPEGRQLFGTMTVWDNLLLGSYSVRGEVRRETVESRLDMIFLLFPILKERLTQRADTMSGGQQQMLAIGRALMANPKLLALDEPSLGLSPKLVGEMMQVLKRICSEWGLSLLLVEQNARAALKIADHVYVLERGEVVLHGTCGEVVESEQIRRAYLGG